MSGEVRWAYQAAFVVAQELVALLGSSCERIEIAGSLRRHKFDVGDIELLCIPKPSDNLFFTDALDEAIKGLQGTVFELRPSIKGVFTYGVKNKLLIHKPSGIPLDVFTTDEKNWGMALVVRTGSAEFNIRMMQRFIDLRMKGHAYGGITSASGEEIDCPDEETVFRNLGWAYLPPMQRTWAK